MNRAVITALIGGALGCAHGNTLSASLAADETTDVATTRPQLIAELQAEVIDALDRDEPMTTGARTVDAKLGGARLGVGPGDVAVADDVITSQSRWPLLLDRHLISEMRSKKMLVHVADDGSAAWVFDDLSWRIRACGIDAVIPLRFTALFTRESDRWVEIVEHLSFGRDTSAKDVAGFGTPIVAATSAWSGGAAPFDALDAALAPSWSATRPIVMQSDANSTAIGPRAISESHGDAMHLDVLIPGGARVEARRIGLVGRAPERATVAYWVGTLITLGGDGSPAGLRLRATAILQKHGPQWIVEQVHVSLPTEDNELADRVFGSSLQSLNPLSISCDKFEGMPTVKKVMPIADTVIKSPSEK